jgi:hypothetical protein
MKIYYELTYDIEGYTDCIIPSPETIGSCNVKDIVNAALNTNELNRHMFYVTEWDSSTFNTSNPEILSQENLTYWLEGCINE